MSGIIDLEHLARYTGGEKAINAEILRLFDDQVTAMVGQLRSVIAVRDAKRWKEITHTIKGAARGVGAFAFGEAAVRQPTTSGPANGERAAQAIARLSEEAMAVHDFIRQYLAA